MSKDWAHDDNEESLAQGWGLFHVEEHQHYELWKYDESSRFRTDKAARKYVYRRALDGDRLAKKAMRFLQRHCMAEYRRVEQENR